MADSVQYALDRMVVDLDDLRYRGIFSEAEVRTIVARRREFEYMLQRHEARRLDFMRYVEYELNLESLRALRTKRIEGGGVHPGGGGKKKGRKGKAATADFCCVRLVRWIFDRAVMKFPGDVDIWLHYIDFAARQGQSKTLGRLFARALQLHPRNPGLWIKAASWEFFDAGNASSARSLMQRALRINPSAQNLWLQYFRLEFSYVEKLMGRREILGLEAEGEEAASSAAAAAAAMAAGVDKAGGGLASMDIPELEAEEGQSGATSFEAVKEAAVAPVAPAMNDTARSFYKGAVPMAVYRAAIKAIPRDLGFRAGFLRCCAADFPVLATEAARAILASLERDFPESCEAWELRATYPVLVAEGRGGGGKDAWRERGRGRGRGPISGGDDGLGPAGRKCVDTFESAVAAVGESSPDMWVRYASFLRQRLEACEDGGEVERGGGEEAGGEGGARKRRRKGGLGGRAPMPTGADALSARLRDVLSRAVDIHLAGAQVQEESTPPAADNTTSTSAIAAAIEARRKRGGASIFATGGGEEHQLGASDRRRAEAEEAREALATALADVCLERGEPQEALSALRSATKSLPRRPGPWLRLAALERRLAASAVAGGGSSENQRHAGKYNNGSDSNGDSDCDSGSSSESSSAGASDAGVAAAAATLRAGVEAVPATDPGYPEIWRELLASLMGGGRSKKKTVAAAFRGAVKACDPSATVGVGGNIGADLAGAAQGEFLAAYIRWSAAAEGVDAARRAMQWARRCFLLSGSGAAAAYSEAIELERALGEVGTGAGAGARAGGKGGERAKRVRELFEDAVDKFGKEMPGMWQEYVDFEIQEGDIKRANAVRWRSQQQQR